MLGDVSTILSTVLATVSTILYIIVDYVRDLSTLLRRCADFVVDDVGRYVGHVVDNVSTIVDKFVGYCRQFSVLATIFAILSTIFYENARVDAIARIADKMANSSTQ